MKNEKSKNIVKYCSKQVQTRRVTKNFNFFIEKIEKNSKKMDKKTYIFKNSKNLGTNWQKLKKYRKFGSKKNEKNRKMSLNTEV